MQLRGALSIDAHDLQRTGDALKDKAYRGANRLKNRPLYTLGVTKEPSESEANANWRLHWKSKRRPKQSLKTGLDKWLQCFPLKNGCDI
jgi:hypothetical protein